MTTPFKIVTSRSEAGWGGGVIKALREAPSPKSSIWKTSGYCPHGASNYLKRKISPNTASTLAANTAEYRTMRVQIDKKYVPDEISTKSSIWYLFRFLWCEKSKIILWCQLYFRKKRSNSWTIRVKVKARLKGSSCVWKNWQINWTKLKGDQKFS